MKLHPLFSAALIVASFLFSGCYPPRVVETSPVPGPDGRVDVKVDAPAPPPAPVRRPLKDVEVEVRPGAGVNIEVKPK